METLYASSMHEALSANPESQTPSRYGSNNFR